MRIAFVLLLSVSAIAQVNGTPASVGSLRSDGGFMVPSGVPASVTSPGPSGWAAPAPHGHKPWHPRGPVVPVYVPVYYGGYYPYITYTDFSYPQAQERVRERVVEKETQKVEIVIVDKRADEKKAEAEAAELKAAAEPKKSNLGDPPDVPAIFIFKDGSRRELANFAMMAGNLYDLSDGKLVKIALASIDRDATRAANAKAGRDIQLP